MVFLILVSLPWLYHDNKENSGIKCQTCQNGFMHTILFPLTIVQLYVALSRCTNQQNLKIALSLPIIFLFVNLIVLAACAKRHNRSQLVNVQGTKYM